MRRRKLADNEPAMNPATLNLTTEITGFGRFLFVRLEPARVETPLLRALEALGAAFESMHFVDGHPAEAALRGGRLQYLRAEPEMSGERDIGDPAIARANALIRLEGRELEPLLAYEGRACSLIAEHGGEVHVHCGVQKPRSYTSYAMTQFAYAHARAPASGSAHPLAVVTPQNKTREWWEMDWMRRESFFLPRYGEDGRMVAKGHALASAAGIPRINRRLFHHPGGYGLGEGYDFIGYFEFAEPDAGVFREVMAALRDHAQNPEWQYVREGPEWWGRRVGRPDELWSSPDSG